MSENLKITGSYILICLLWGSTWLAIRLGLNSLTPFISSGIRFIIAAIMIYTIMYFKGEKLQTDSISMKLYFFMGYFSFVIPFGLVYWAEQFIPSGLASILFAVFPLIVIILSRFAFSKQRIELYQLIGVAFGFLGLLVIFSESISLGDGYNIWGIIAIIVSAAMQAINILVIKKYGGHLNSLSMNFVPLSVAGVSLVIVSLFIEDSTNWVFNKPAIFSILYLAFFGSVVAFTTYYWLLKRINAVIISLSSFITPIIAVLLGWLIIDESLSFRDLIGSSFVLIGILFANLRDLKNYYILKISKD